VVNSRGQSWIPVGIFYYIEANLGLDIDILTTLAEDVSDIFSEIKDNTSQKQNPHKHKPSQTTVHRSSIQISLSFKDYYSSHNPSFDQLHLAPPLAYILKFSKLSQHDVHLLQD
jgi:hypothetical protein